MTQPASNRPRHEEGRFREARAAATSIETGRRALAARTVAGNAVDAQDCRELLCMLGLHDPGSSPDHSPTDTPVPSWTTPTSWTGRF
jgi:hypothetical protein